MRDVAAYKGQLADRQIRGVGVYRLSIRTHYVALNAPRRNLKG